jgi:hypothetical protein
MRTLQNAPDTLDVRDSQDSKGGTLVEIPDSRERELFFKMFLLGIFLTYISMLSQKSPTGSSTHSPIYPLPLLGLGVPLY